MLAGRPGGVEAVADGGTAIEEESPTPKDLEWTCYRDPPLTPAAVAIQIEMMAVALDTLASRLGLVLLTLNGSAEVLLSVGSYQADAQARLDLWLSHREAEVVARAIMNRRQRGELTLDETSAALPPWRLQQVREQVLGSLDNDRGQSAGHIACSIPDDVGVVRRLLKQLEQDGLAVYDGPAGKIGRGWCRATPRTKQQDDSPTAPR